MIPVENHQENNAISAAIQGELSISTQAPSVGCQALCACAQES